MINNDALENVDSFNYLDIKFIYNGFIYSTLYNTDMLDGIQIKISQEKLNTHQGCFGEISRYSVSVLLKRKILNY